jgi:hypothetical protein
VLRACIRRYPRNGIGHNAALDGVGLYTHTQAQAVAALSTKSDGVSTGPVTVPWRDGCADCTHVDARCNIGYSQ